MFPSDPSVSVLTLPDYAESQMRHGLKDASETPGRHVSEIIGDVAMVRQEFTMNFAGRTPVPAVDIFTLARLSGGWKVVAVVSDVRDPHGLPAT